ncbi:MAG: radical SAM protein, partial [Candidatus Thermoplasmatota archaeon]|nr:radical SAM protein [Candidatus Thermoplasmatota archaeon]
MDYKEIRVSELITRITKKDTLFCGDFTIDPYQYCEFSCNYCDSSFSDSIKIKTNAAEILRNELENLEMGRIIVGSVHDPYQDAEKKYQLARKLLSVILEFDFPCHILTKSPLVLRDLDILKDLKDCIVTISVCSLKESVYSIFEPNVSLPLQRLNVIKTLSENGIVSGLAIIPVLPYFVDDELEKIIKCARNYNALYVLSRSLELKGDQRDVFLKLIDKINSNLLSKYQKLYWENYLPDHNYTLKIKNKIDEIC